MIKFKWWIWTLMGNGLHPKEATTSKMKYTVKHSIPLKAVQALYHQKAGPPCNLLPRLFLKCALVLRWLALAYQVQFAQVTLWFLAHKLITFQYLSLPSICSCQYVKLLHIALISDVQRGPLRDPLIVLLNEKCLVCVVTLCPCVNGCAVMVVYHLAEREKHIS